MDEPKKNASGPHRSWEDNFNLYSEYVANTGRFLPPTKEVIGPGFAVGKWVRVQKTRRVSLGTSQQHKLEKLTDSHGNLGWSWNPSLTTHQSDWMKKFEALKAFVVEHGHTLIEAGETYQGVELGSWVRWIRQRKHRQNEERAGLLEGLENKAGEKVWVWNVQAPFRPDRRQKLSDANWSRNFQKYKDHVLSTGNIYVDWDETTTDGFIIGRWVRRQREKRDSMPEGRRAALEGFVLPHNTTGWSWSSRPIVVGNDRGGEPKIIYAHPNSMHARAQEWMLHFEALQVFVSQEGHANVDPEFQTSDGLELGAWVKRTRRYRTKMNTKRIELLEGLTNQQGELVWDWRANRPRRNTETGRQFPFRVGARDGAEEAAVPAPNARVAEKTSKPPTELGKSREDQLGVALIGLRILHGFVAETGSMHIPPNVVIEEFRLGSWVELTVGAIRKGALHPDAQKLVVEGLHKIQQDFQARKGSHHLEPVGR